MNTTSLPTPTAAIASAPPPAEGKVAKHEVATTGNDDRFARLLRAKEAARKEPPATASTESSQGATEAAPAAVAQPRQGEPSEASQEQDEDTRDWPPAALALLGMPWAHATPPATPVASPETTIGIAPGVLPGGSRGASSTLHALAPAIDALLASDGEAAPPVAAGVAPTTGVPGDALPVDNTASTSKSLQSPLPSATPLAVTAQAITPDALPIAATLKELTDTLRQGADGDATAPTVNALAAPAPSVNGLPRTATVNPLAAPTPELHSEHFDEAIGTRLTWMAEQKIGHAHIRMTPEQLGPVEIRLRLDGDRVHADFNSAQPEVRQALESSLPKLREMLGQQGFQLAQADVGHRQDAPSRHPAAHAQHDLPAADGVEIRGSTPTPRLSIRGLVDAYA